MNNWSYIAFDETPGKKNLYFKQTVISDMTLLLILGPFLLIFAQGDIYELSIITVVSCSMLLLAARIVYSLIWVFSKYKIDESGITFRADFFANTYYYVYNWDKIKYIRKRRVLIHGEYEIIYTFVIGKESSNRYSVMNRGTLNSANPRNLMPIINSEKLQILLRRYFPVELGNCPEGKIDNPLYKQE